MLFVLAGVNGAGKSSIGGHLLTQAGLAWFNPDTCARELVREHGYGQEDANIAAWNEGVRRLDLAVRTRKTYAFETTLGGDTITQKLMAASASHDVLVCVLRPARCRAAYPAGAPARARGGHDIPEDRIRQRCRTSLLNLIILMPRLAQLRAYDNSVDVAVGTAVPEPRLVLGMDQGRLIPDHARRHPRHARLGQGAGRGRRISPLTLRDPMNRKTRTNFL